MSQVQSEAIDTQGSKLYGPLLVAAAAIGAVVNALHPINTGDIDETLTSLAESGGWVLLHVGIIVTIVFLVAGLVGFASSLEATAGGFMARVAAALTILGGAVAVIALAMDGITLKALADSWASAPAGDAPTLLGQFSTAKAINEALWATTVFLFFGVAVVAHGLAARLSHRLPSWVGGGAIVAGVGSVVAGLMLISTAGESSPGEFVFLASSVLLTIWALAVGYRWWRGRLFEVTPPGRVREARVGT